MPLYELKSARDLEIAIARKLPLRVSCCGGLNCCEKEEIVWNSNENTFVENDEGRDYCSDKHHVLEDIKLNYDDSEEDIGYDRYYSEQPLIGKILKGHLYENRRRNN